MEANAELVVTRTATNGQLINQQRVVDLPLNGRTAQSLVFLAAGTVDLSSKYCGVGCHGGVYPGEQVAGVNGAGSANVNYQLDGADHNDTYINMNLPFPNPDSIQEFNLQSENFTAEYGNAGGGIVNIVTKSGTNQIHGSAFEFLRNGALNARNFFAPTHDTLKRNQFGGTLGGPIVKDKLFFFGTYQGTRVRSAPAGRIAFVPTAAERGGDISSSSKVLVDPVSGAATPGQPDPGQPHQRAGQILPQSIPLPNAGGRQLNFAGSPTAQIGKPVHDQDRLQPAQASVQRPLLLHRFRPARRDSDREPARGHGRRQPGARAEHLREPHLLFTPPPSYQQHFRARAAARRIAL